MVLERRSYDAWDFVTGIYDAGKYAATKIVKPVLTTTYNYVVKPVGKGLYRGAASLHRLLSGSAGERKKFNF